MSKMKFSPLPSCTNTDVFICPGRSIGAVPIKMIRSSSGPSCSLRGNHWAALLRPGVGSMPSKSSPSFQRPSGIPPVSVASISSGEEGG